MTKNNRIPRRPVMSRGARPNRQVVRMDENKFLDIARKAATRLTEDYSANNTFNNPYTELNNELSEFGDVRVSGIYSNGLDQLCIAAKRGADTRAIKDFMKTKGYDYYTAGGNDKYLMMDFTRAKDARMNPNRQVVQMNENKFVDIVCEVAMRVVDEMRNNRPLSDYSDEIDRRWRNGDNEAWEVAKGLDRAQRVHALRNDEFPTADWNGETYTIDDPLPEDCRAVHVHMTGAPYANNAYPNPGESLRDWAESMNIEMADITDWWVE